MNNESNPVSESEQETLDGERPISANSLDKIYIEAGQWIRMCNTIVWSMGAFLVPLSAGSVGLALQYPRQQRFFAATSVFLFSFWVYVSKLYRETAAEARTVLIGLEMEWNIPQTLFLYRLHGQVGKRWYSLFHVQIIALILLVISLAVYLGVSDSVHLAV